jgi:dCMP deaminase
LTLEEFVDFDDKIKFNSEEFSLFSTSSEKQNYVKRRFHNKTDNLIDFYQELRKFCFNDRQLVRPSFDTYFLRLAEVAASRSNCMKSGIGAVIAKD